MTLQTIAAWCGSGSSLSHQPEGNLAARPTIRQVWNSLDLIQEPPPPGEPAAAAVLIALYESPDGLTRLVLTKRPDTMPTHAGHIAFPGGRPDPADKGPLETALREAHEEVGISPEKVDVVGYLPPIHTVEYRLMVVPVVGHLPAPPNWFRLPGRWCGSMSRLSMSYPNRTCGAPRTGTGTGSGSTTWRGTCCGGPRR